MNYYRIDYRFNKHGRKPHVFDVIDDTGYCIASFNSLDVEEAITEARNFVAEEKLRGDMKTNLSER